MDKEDNIINVNFNKAKYESNEILDEALDCESRSKALKLAKKAVEIYPNNIDALSFINQYETDEIKKLEKFNEIVKKATEELEKENMFEEDNIGNFWGLIETRPYMRARHNKLLCLLNLGRYTEAIAECEDLLRLCNSDNMGIRYILIGLYCLLEKFDEAEKLFEKYNERITHFLLPMAILYYKKGDYKKTKKFLKVLNDTNEFILDYLIDYDSIDEEMFYQEYYSWGSEEEAALAIKDLSYLLATVPKFNEFVMKSFK